MKKLAVGLLLVPVPMLAMDAGVAPAPASAPAAVESPTLEESRGLAMQLQVRLRQELDAAVASGGPLAAISVCSERAAAIAAELSRESGATVSRTSLKVRNPENEPEPWQVAGLDRLEQMAAEAAAAGATRPLEIWEAAVVDGTSARYLRAIPTAPMCLVCHGATLAPEVQAAIAEHYPEDRATGYETGSIRGALSVVWHTPVAAP